MLYPNTIWSVVMCTFYMSVCLSLLYSILFHLNSIPRHNTYKMNASLIICLTWLSMNLTVSETFKMCYNITNSQYDKHYYIDETLNRLWTKLHLSFVRKYLMNLHAVRWREWRKLPSYPNLTKFGQTCFIQPCKCEIYSKTNIR